MCTHHSRLRTSLLTLEEHRILQMALWALLITSRQGRIGSDILRHASCLTLLVVEHVAEDAGGDGVFGVLAGAAGELELVGVWVFFWVEHVGAMRPLVEDIVS